MRWSSSYAKQPEGLGKPGPSALYRAPFHFDAFCKSTSPGGTYPTIQAAVDKAAAGDTIQVAPGTYYEDVMIGKPLSLVGAGCGRSTINAMGLPTGIYIDGIDNPGLSKVVVTGFTIENANFEGILVTNASFITIWGNEVINNDKGLDPSVPECKGQPPFETNEGFDCGEGIHLSGVDHSVVSHNTSKHNAGGILLSDDTGATHDNLITGNVVMNNPFDCRITLASHAAFPVLSPPLPPFGVFHNTIAENESSNNGLAVEGAGAGVGIFDSVPGTQNYGNVVINNQLKDNGLPGVAMHSHTPGQNLNDNPSSVTIFQATARIPRTRRRRDRPGSTSSASPPLLARSFRET